MSTFSIFNWHVNVSLPVYYYVIPFHVEILYLPFVYIFIVQQPFWVSSTDFVICWQPRFIDVIGLRIDKTFFILLLIIILYIVFVKLQINQAFCFFTDLISKRCAKGGSYDFWWPYDSKSFCINLISEYVAVPRGQIISVVNLTVICFISKHWVWLRISQCR